MKKSNTQIAAAVVPVLLFAIHLIFTQCDDSESLDKEYPSLEDIKWSTASKGKQLDLTGYSLTFEDNFDDMSGISAEGGKGPWFAPIHSDVGAAKFMKPDANPSPFIASNGQLTIRAQQVNGQWQTGHMQTSDSYGRGFSQQYGYFEIKAKMPPEGTWGTWTAFWLYSTTTYTKKSKTRAEIDIIEYYAGRDADGHHSSLHLRPGIPVQEGEISEHWSKGLIDKIPTLKDSGWHTYGAMVTKEWIIIYLDNKELKRIPTLPEFHTPLYLLVSNQLLPQESDRAVPPIDFIVDYVRVYAKD